MKPAFRSPLIFINKVRGLCDSHKKWCTKHDAKNHVFRWSKARAVKRIEGLSACASAGPAMAVDWRSIGVFSSTGCGVKRVDAMNRKQQRRMGIIKTAVGVSACELENGLLT